jgi:hypothetical protein
MRVNPVPSPITRILACEFSRIADHVILDSLLTSCGRLHGQTVRYMAVYGENTVVAVFRSGQSIYNYGVPHVIKGRHCAHISSGCRQWFVKSSGCPAREIGHVDRSWGNLPT